MRRPVGVLRSVSHGLPSQCTVLEAVDNAVISGIERLSVPHSLHLKQKPAASIHFYLIVLEETRNFAAKLCMQAGAHHAATVQDALCEVCCVSLLVQVLCGASPHLLCPACHSQHSLSPWLVHCCHNAVGDTAGGVEGAEPRGHCYPGGATNSPKGPCCAGTRRVQCSPGIFAALLFCCWLTVCSTVLCQAHLRCCACDNMLLAGTHSRSACLSLAAPVCLLPCSHCAFEVWLGVRV